jgi:exonuclease SbcD
VSEHLLSRAQARRIAVQAQLLDAHRPEDLSRRVTQRFPHALVVHHRAAVSAETSRTKIVTAAHDPLDVTADFLAHVTGHGPTPAEVEVLRRAYEDVAAMERSA